MHLFTQIAQWLGHKRAEAARARLAIQAEQEQRRFAEALRDSLVVLTSSLNVEIVMQQILAYAATVVPSEAGSIILFEGDYGHVAYLRGFPPEAEAFFKAYRFPIASIPGGNILADKQPYLVPDTQAEPQWVALPVSAWIRSSIGIPIERHGEVIGLLVVDSATPHHFQPADMEKLQAFARYAGLALDNAYHFAQLEQRVMERTAGLQAAKERLEAILNHSFDAILLVGPDFHIQQTNLAFTRLFACEPHDYIGHPLGDLLHEADVAHVNVALQMAIREQTGQQVELRCYRKNGTLFEAELSTGPITAETETAGFVCTLRDITARKEAEGVMQQSLQKEKELNELKSRFVSMASHELRTPLTVILALTNTLRAYWHQLGDPQIEQRLDKIKEQVIHLETIVTDMLHLACLQVQRSRLVPGEAPSPVSEFNPVRLDLDDLCRSVLDEFQLQPTVTHPFLYTCDPALSRLNLDPKLMRQIITNLVANAMKYSRVDKPILVRLAYANEILSITVRDEGIGIPAADLNQIFEPFHRATNLGSIAGTGLGLAIVKEAVELHGGTITVASEVGVGTTFTITIPIAAHEEKDRAQNSGD